MSCNKLVTRSEPHHQGLKSYCFVFAIISITNMFFYPRLDFIYFTEPGDDPHLYSE